MLWMNVFDTTTTTTTIQCLLISDSVLVRLKYWDCNAVCYTQQLIWKSGIASFHWNDEKSGVKIKTIHWIKDNMSIIKMLFRANLVSKLFIKKQKAKGTDLSWLHKKSGVKTFHWTATSDKSGVEIIHRMASVGRWLDGWGVSQVTDSPCRASCSATCFYWCAEEKDHICVYICLKLQNVFV